LRPTRVDKLEESGFIPVKFEKKVGGLTVVVELNGRSGGHITIHRGSHVVTYKELSMIHIPTIEGYIKEAASAGFSTTE